MWSALDEDGNGELDISEFPRFLEVVEKEIARVAAIEDAPTVQLSVLQAAQDVAAQSRVS